MMTPDYTLRYSQKAKYLQLRISIEGLELVVPSRQRVSQTMIEQFLQQKKSWMLRHWQRWLQTQEKHDTLPISIPLLAIAQTWDVFYLTMATPKMQCITNQSRQIKLLGDITQQAKCIRLLRQWLKKMASQYLAEQLQSLATTHDLSFGQLSFRHTITRWGSCSINKNMSLCCNLLFLPPHLVTHVLLHELSHTKVMSHGKRFWQLLKKLDPDCDANRIELKKAGDYVPLWARKKLIEKKI